MAHSEQSQVYPAVLLADNDIQALREYEMQLWGEGITNCVFSMNEQQTYDILASQEVSLIVLDLRIAKSSGAYFLTALIRKYPQLPILVITSIDDVEIAVQCMRAGAFNYLVKPVNRSRFGIEVNRALEFWELRHENIRLRESVLEQQIYHPEAFAKIVTRSPKMYAIFRYIESIAPSSQPVLVTGETGAGKEMIVQAIHTLSQRKGAFIAVNVAGLDDSTFSDALFGHKRGAFTGANLERAGFVERAAKGTLFLDEIGDLPCPSQVKLLRLLQEREYYPLGSDTPKPTTARVVVATNCDLLALQESGKFRPDLYYRLTLHRIHVPPLRERREDIPLLVDAFLAEAAQELQKSKPTPPPELFTLLAVYPFPGNIRELRSMVFDAVSRHRSGTLSLASFKEATRYHPLMETNPVNSGSAMTSGTSIKTLRNAYAALDYTPTLDEAANVLIEETLKRTDGNLSLTASLLGVTRQTLRRRMRMNKTA